MSLANSPCAACKFQRRKCTQECVFAPYFPPDNPERFVCVHRVFGASNVTKLLKELSTSQRQYAVKSLAYEAEARLRDPVYGCVGFISVLQHQLRQIIAEIDGARKELANYVSPQSVQTLLANPGTLPPPGVLMSHLRQSLHNSGCNNVSAIYDPQRPEFLETQRLDTLVSSKTREQQKQLMFRNYEQQQELMNFTGGLEGVIVGNQMGDAVHADMLSLATSENIGPYQMRQQQWEHHVPLHSQCYSIVPHMLLSPQHQQTQQSQQQCYQLQQQQSETEDGARSGCPS